MEFQIPSGSSPEVPLNCPICLFSLSNHSKKVSDNFTKLFHIASNYSKNVKLFKIFQNVPNILEIFENPEMELHQSGDIYGMYNSHLCVTVTASY